MVRDVSLAEDLAQDAFVAALAQWPDEGIPRNPGAWLVTAARRRAIDSLRRDQTRRRNQDGVAQTLYSRDPDADFAAAHEEVDDDMLALIFVACHPAVSKDAHLALTLKLAGGLTTAEIARAFLVPEATIAQRIVRAKRTLSQSRVPFEVPAAGQGRRERLASILETIYLIFNEGYSATSGDDVLRPELVEDALRLGRMLAALMPNESEVHSLAALMEIQASRTRARVGPAGEPILLLDQDRGRWNQLLIRRGFDALARALRLGGTRGTYALQAEIAACHARAATAQETDWPRIAQLYDALAELAPSPVVELNRAVATGMAFGAQAGLDAVEGLRGEPALRDYHLLPSVRGDLLVKLGRFAEARTEFERAASLALNRRDRELLLGRAAQLTV
jgi:RNA polymerase sigma factor (sigma-70 family)